MMRKEIPAVYAASAFGLLGIVQALLAAGVLPGGIAYGGAHAVLPPDLRRTSIFAAFVLVFFAYVTLRRSHLIGSKTVSKLSSNLYWVIPAYMALNTLGNFVSRSTFEKLFFGFLTLSLTITTYLVARNK